jgi:DNA (cytosine-5)-methyltransferase 1
MLRAIQEIKPKYVIAENVFGITNIDGGLVFEQVCLDLENEGYEVQPFIIPAAAKNAPHRRDRCWFIAQNPLFSGRIHRGDEQKRTEIRQFGNTCTGSADRIYLSKGVATNTNCYGFNKQWRYDSSRQDYARGNSPIKWSANSKNIDNGDSSTNIVGQSTINTRIGEQANVETNQFATAEGICRLDTECDQFKGIIKLDRCETLNGGTLVQDGCEGIQSPQYRGMDKDCGDISGNGANECKDDGTIINRMDGYATDTNSIGQEFRQERECSKRKSQSVDKQFKRCSKLYGGNFEKFPSQSPICSGDDGIPTQLDGITFPKWRAESIKGYGNAIVPQIAYSLFEIIQELNENN